MLHLISTEKLVKLWSRLNLDGSLLAASNEDSHTVARVLTDRQVFLRLTYRAYGGFWIFLILAHRYFVPCTSDPANIDPPTEKLRQNSRDTRA